MTVKTKSIFEKPKTEDGRRVLITRFYPRGVERDRFDEWATELSPSPDLLFSFKEGRKSWAEFIIEFVTQLANDIDSLDAIHTLNVVSKKRDVTLLCYEKSGNPCHRHIVRDIVENPKLLFRFEPEDTNDHERITVQSHIPYE